VCSSWCAARLMLPVCMLMLLAFPPGKQVSQQTQRQQQYLQPTSPNIWLVDYGKGVFIMVCCRSAAACAYAGPPILFPEEQVSQRMQKQQQYLQPTRRDAPFFPSRRASAPADAEAAAPKRRNCVCAMLCLQHTALLPTRFWNVLLPLPCAIRSATWAPAGKNCL
jgi:hypothetical protein